MMKYTNWIGIAASLMLIVVCFNTWVYIPSVQLHIGGMQASGKHNFGKPGMLHILLSAIAILLFLIPLVWAKRTNVFVAGFNMSWAIRNYIVLSKCYAGECPEKQSAFYILLAASSLLLLMALLPTNAARSTFNAERLTPNAEH
jgi:hypothetical protein